MRRRDFLSAGAALTAAACTPKAAPSLPPGTLGGPDRGLGHRLLTRDFPPPSATRRTRVLIVGGGVAGLSAGWRLARAGCDDFLLLELEGEPGGNARAGSNAVSAYPLAAHYLPLPPPEAVAVRLLLGELGAIVGDPFAARPTYDERLVSQAPQERLYRDGLWQEGLLPQTGGDQAERAQQRRFHARIDEFKRRRDGQGRRAFAVPMAKSARDPELLALDRLSFRDWLLGEGFDSPSLLWLADYACRDDFGTGAAECSAWAGVHYFASRSGEGANAIAEAVLTAPEGNAWLTRGLAAAVSRGAAGRLRCGALVHSLRETRSGIEAEVYLAAEGRSETITAERVIWAAPLFLLPRVVDGLPGGVRAALAGFDYAPWVVANLTLRGWPADAHGAPPAWDNVLHAGAGLGYVVATHQQLRVTPGPTVWTWYRALSDATPARWRQALERTSRESWAASVLAELSRPHRDLADHVDSIDVRVYGHAMVRPTPGLIWGGAREALAAGFGRLHPAHADCSGMSLFEEANDRGIAAAEAVLQRFGRRSESLRG